MLAYIFEKFVLLAILCFAFVTVACVIIPLVACVARWRISKYKRKDKPHTNVAFFHPYCNAGGGGERVLWRAIVELLRKYDNAIRIVVYTGDVNASPADIKTRARQRFNIDVPDGVEFVYLYRRGWVEAKKYPHFTLLGQNFGSIWLGIEALKAHIPDILIDTMGYPFVLPLFALVAGCRVASYVHYPIITADMMERVSSRKAAFNNSPFIARNPAFTLGKLLYYKVFAAMYAWVGKCNAVVMVNSTWTEDHINALWRMPLLTHRVYPPCDTTDLHKIKFEKDYDKKIKIVSVGQFRPEKDHPLQLATMYHLRQIVSEEIFDSVELVVIGSTRNEEDETRVKDMKDLCRHLSVENNVTFKINVSYEDLKRELEDAIIAIHTMQDEHFGISVVECMAAGLIVIAHRSGGPKLDIIEESEGSRAGFLAGNEAEYAQAIALVIGLSKGSKDKIRETARASVSRFSEWEFGQNFLRATQPLFAIKKNS